MTQTDTGGVIDKIEAEARRYAEMYQPHSDGRNTFVIFADWVAALREEIAPPAEQQMLEKQFAGRTSPKGSSVEDHTFAESSPSAEPVAWLEREVRLKLADAIESKINKPCGEFIIASLEGKIVIDALRAPSPSAEPVAWTVADQNSLVLIRNAIVLSLAFLGRDAGSSRSEHTTPQIIQMLANADTEVRRLLAASRVSDASREALAIEWDR